MMYFPVLEIRKSRYGLKGIRTNLFIESNKEFMINPVCPTRKLFIELINDAGLRLELKNAFHNFIYSVSTKN